MSTMSYYEAPLGKLDESLDYVFADTLEEVLLEAKKQIDMARNQSEVIILGVRLKLARRAIDCALEILGDREKEKRR